MNTKEGDQKHRMVTFFFLELVDNELVWLRYSDSNADWGNQNPMCYHYTIPQFKFIYTASSKIRIFKDA